MKNTNMTKNDIKLKLLKEIELIIEDENGDKAEHHGSKKDYSDVRRAIEKVGGPSIVDVMKLTGIPDDESGTNRSLFRKKIKQIKNPENNSYYQFSDEELPQVRAALNIQR